MTVYIEVYGESSRARLVVQDVTAIEPDESTSVILHIVNGATMYVDHVRLIHLHAPPP